MEYSIRDRFKSAWNAFRSIPVETFRQETSYGYSSRPDRVRLSRGNEKSMVNSIYNRISLDVAAIKIQHVRLDKNGRFLEEMDSKLNRCLTLETNVDQTPRSFIQDVVLSLFDEGCVAIVPVDATANILYTDSYGINSLRVGKIVEWYPRKVKILLYNDQTGKKEEIILPKTCVAIVTNPLYSVINEPNSTMQRLVRKLNLLDIIDEQSGSGKLDLIISLPYAVKTETRKAQAEKRRADIVDQLANSKYGIAYTDGTEKITQLNRPIENNLLKQIEFLTSMLNSQLGITQAIMDGTADEKTMLNYYDRTIEPIVSAIVDELKRKFLSETARSQRQSILFFRDPFKLVPVSDLAEMADKFTRNEIMTSNEIRQIVGLKPSSDPKADELINSNLNHPEEKLLNEQGVEMPEDGMEEMPEEEMDIPEEEVEESEEPKEEPVERSMIPKGAKIPKDPLSRRK